jgi:hypothetical protein
MAATTKASAAEEAASKGTGMATLLSLLRASTMEDKSFVSAAGAGGEEKVEWLRSQLIGKGVEFDTPFGRRVLTYADQTASGRSLRYIEDYIVNEVLPFYGEGCAAILAHTGWLRNLFLQTCPVYLTVCDTCV